MLEHFDSGEARFFILEWARRHRKTTLLINLLIRECCLYPRIKNVYVAPTQVWARNVVWDDPLMLKEALPPKEEMDYTMHSQQMTIEFANGSILKIGGSDKPDTFRGIDAFRVGFDEWALCKETLWTEVFRPILAGPLPPHLPKVWEHQALNDQGKFESYKIKVRRIAIFLYTPKGINHASIMFDNACCLAEMGSELPTCGVSKMLKPGWYASRIDAEEFGLIEEAELKQMQKDMPIVLYQQEMKCKRAADEEMTLITSAMLSALKDAKTVQLITSENRRIVSVDPAMGGDVCRIMGIINTEVMEEKSLHPSKTSEIVLAVKQMCSTINTKNIVIDIGYNRGIADNLAEDEAEYFVQMFDSSAKAMNERYYANRRAEAYAYTANLIKNLLVAKPASLELLRQLPVASRYKASRNGRLLIIPKEQIRKVLGRSPDDADCWIMGQWGLTRVEPESQKKPSKKFKREVGVHVPANMGV